MNTDNHLPKDNSSVPGRTNDPETFAKFASVKSYQDYLTDKDNPVVMVTLTVNDHGFLDNTTFETYLTQHTNAHDEFTIVVSDTAIDDFYGQVMRNSKNLLGEPITIHIHHKGAVVQSFKGIIAQVSDKRNEGGGYGNLYISGYGLSILLDSGEECQSYENKTLPKIIAEATNEYGDVKVNTKGMVNTKYKIPYVVQYKESDYQFIQRLARRYGEFFFYDGTQLQFNNETRQTVQLSEGDDLIEVAFELKIQPQHFSYLSYGVEKGEVEEKNTKNVRLQDKGNPFQFAAVKASEKVFTKKTKVPYNAFTEEFRGDYLADNVRREKESREQLMEVRGRSRNPNLRIGGFVKLKDINDKPMESYRIIDIKHHQSGYDYENEFVAIPDVYIAYYYDREALPRAEQQIARVTDNNDPKGLGRVRVQFIWQVAKKLQTPWIRVVQPHAGGGKGFYFIPEIGEEVLVDFEDQNAERPFVIGSHYNGKEYSPFHNTNNDIKAIQTRSGHKLIFTEDESILLSDKNGNTLRFDTQGKNIEISAPESISLCAGKDINLSAGNNLLMDVANVASFNILQQLLVNTPYMKQLVTELFHTQAGKALINSDDQIKIEAKEMNVAGMQKLLLHSDQDAVVNSKGYLDMRGEQGNKMKNKAEEYEEVIEEIKTKCLVHFRPHNDWKGEYGFDWFRTGDTGMEGDNNFNDIIGFYYESEDKNAKKFENANAWKDDYFRIDGELCEKHTNGFDKFICNQFKDYEYFVPKMTLLKGKTACLRLIVQKKSENIDGYITFNFLNPNAYKHFQLTCEQLKLSDIEQDCSFEITCIEEIQSIQKLQILLNGEMCGMLEIYPNKIEFQKSWNIQIVRVYHNVYDKKTDIEKEEVATIKQVFNQALVKIQINKEIHNLKMNFKYTDKEKIDTKDLKKKPKKIDTKDIEKKLKKIDTKDLEEKPKKIDAEDLEEKLKEIYMRDYIKNRLFERVIFLVDGMSSSGELGQTPYGLGFSICFRDRNRQTTITHELLHSFNLLHTFTSTPQKGYATGPVDKKVDPSVVYKAKKTDNIMDYSDNRFTLYYWQWIIINKNLKL